LVLVGLSVSLVSLSLADAVRRSGPQLAADQFVTAYWLARSAAARYGRVAELHIDVAAGRFWVEVDTARLGGVTDTIGTVRNVPQAVSLTSNRSMVCFEPRGLPTTRGSCEAANATVVFTQDGKSDTVKVTTLGKVLR
jgi:hypothetical protein